MENLDKKDYFYYTDMIADLKMIAGIGKIDDEFQKERIQGRHRYVSKLGENGNTIFVTSDYKKELIDLCSQIYYKATGRDELTFLYEIRDFIPEVNDAILELETKRRNCVIEDEYPKVKMTKEMIYEIISNPEKFVDSYVRFYQGNIYTEDEFQKLVQYDSDLVVQGDIVQHKLQR